MEGEAARVISNLEVSEANYAEAWSLLCGRYNNKRQLINNHLNSLFSIEPLQRESDKALRFLSDHVTKNLRALKNLGQPTDTWDTVVIHMLTTKLDQSTGTKWEEYRNNLDELPTLEDFKKFLNNRADVLESIYRSKKDKQPSNSLNAQARAPVNNSSGSKPVKFTKSFLISGQHPTPRPCVLCQGKHRAYECNVLKALSEEERWAQVNKLKLCHNCLRPDHDVRRCRLSGCRVCKGRHNTLLHKQHDSQSSPPTCNIETNDNTGEASNSSISMSVVSSNEVLLSTALIEVINPNDNRKEIVKALLDCGSQSSFMSDSLKCRLQLSSQPLNATNILGIGNASLNVTPERCHAQIKSLNTPFTTSLDFLVLPQITDQLPKRYFDIRQLNLPSSLTLADPTFNQPSQIDLLLGADIFWQLISPKQHSLGNKQPILQDSKLGWLIAGSITNNVSPNFNKRSIQCNFTMTERIDQQLTKFWELESFAFDQNSKDPIQNASEQHFVQNTTRLDNGRFCVRLPLKETTDCLGDSFNMAHKRLLSLEKRFEQQPQLKDQYVQFIREYEDLGHLSEAESLKKPYYLPHHAVLKSNSESTKLRVVFDSTARTTSGYSMHDLQMVGPNIQDSLFNILLRFRSHKYVFSGDIEKQYRQISMNELDRELQVILWRENADLPLRTLTLNTVTYGFACASFLAARCLWQLGEECNDPVIKTIIQKDFYCDDCLTGADTEAELLSIQQSVSRALASGCFNLRKYRSNSQALLDSQAANAQDDLVLSQSIQTLGLGWNPGLDSLHFDVDTNNGAVDKATKRSILSTTFKIFDPLGLLSLCTIKPKILMQKLWQAKVGWDDTVPIEIQRAWSRFINNLHYISSLNIPRRVLCDSPTSIELHCFGDASQLAYSACVFMKSVSDSGESYINLICAKTRVCPLKPTATIPRLELCAALLAAQLGSTVQAALRQHVTRSIFWTDSSVVLAWLNADESKLKVFVANRITATKDITERESWRYVPTSLNPADLASRGVDPQHVQNAHLWWHGPPFLTEPESNWPTLHKDTFDDLPEVKAHTTTIDNEESSCDFIDFNKFSRLQTFQRVVAYIYRFIHNCRNKNDKLSGPLSTDELKKSFITLVKRSQEETFPKELKQQQNLSPKSHILSLTPFIDSQGHLRVGGRLSQSDYNYDKKHPLLLSSKHPLTKLIIAQEHRRLLHAGPQLLLASVRETIWPVGGRDLARRMARDCITCRRASGQTLYNIMGNLPHQRLTPDFPFSATAVDFAGPFMITDRRGRGCKITKCYLCLFICLRYKCVHLEAVSELSKDSFILSLRRFISRRGT